MRLSGRHILLVEDDPLVAAHLEAVLDREGANVTLLTSARALSAYDPTETELAVLDIGLGDGDANDHLGALTASGTSLIFHTGTDDTHELERAHPEARILPKPSNESQLVSLCAEMIAARD